VTLNLSKPETNEGSSISLEGLVTDDPVGRYYSVLTAGQRRFLEERQRSYSDTEAAKNAGVRITTVRAWLKSNEAFASVYQYVKLGKDAGVELAHATRMLSIAKRAMAAMDSFLSLDKDVEVESDKYIRTKDQARFALDIMKEVRARSKNRATDNPAGDAEKTNGAEVRELTISNMQKNSG
jgi:hypothetical protein